MHHGERTTDDVILAGFAAEPQYKGKLRVLGRGFSTERYGIVVKRRSSTDRPGRGRSTGLVLRAWAPWTRQH